jgi:carbonic anhydrase
MNAIEKLIKGHADFRDGFYLEHQGYLQELGRKGQSPKVAMISCCDSRVDPAFLTSSVPGDLFAIRNVANLVPPYVEKTSSWHGTSAALQFAVCGLEVEHIIVLGHANCGGIRSLFDHEDGVTEVDGYINAWMRLAAKARDQVLADPALETQEQRISACERRAIQVSLDNLRTYPWILERISQGQLELHGWFYDLVTGKLLCLNEKDSEFYEICS